MNSNEALAKAVDAVIESCKQQGTVAAGIFGLSVTLPSIVNGPHRTGIDLVLLGIAWFVLASSVLMGLLAIGRLVGELSAVGPAQRFDASSLQVAKFYSLFQLIGLFVGVVLLAVVAIIKQVP